MKYIRRLFLNESELKEKVAIKRLLISPMGVELNKFAAIYCMVKFFPFWHKQLSDWSFQTAVLSWNDKLF